MERTKNNSGQFKQGSERAREAGRKGGQASKNKQPTRPSQSREPSNEDTQ